MVEEIEKAIGSKIRPLLAEHNGDIKLLKAEDGIVEVKLLGACSGCPSARFTMEDIVEGVILTIPGVKQVKMIDSISSDMLELARQLLKK